MLFRYSCATHCIEWQAPLQNSFEPVTATITCVPITAAAPITTPTITSASTDQVALGVVRRRHHPLAGADPGVGFSAMAPPYKLSLGKPACDGDPAATLARSTP